jgi:glycosyltransferase involved in cell wall biosynthesis
MRMLLSELYNSARPNMRLGFAMHTGGFFDSLRSITQNLTTILSRNHTIQRTLHPILYASPTEELNVSAQIVRTSDLLLGFHSTLLPLLAARKQTQTATPCLLFVLGAFPRGAIMLKQVLPFLTQNDVFVANCAADVQLVRKFVPDARVELLPWPVDDGLFYPVAEHQRQQVRTEMGFSGDTPVILYAGRITVEKNLHTTLRVFAAVKKLLPQACLLLVGPIQDIPFFEIGSAPCQYGRTLEKVTRELGLSPSDVRYLGWASQDRLRSLYNAADVLINLTIHHDENFGLGQVEAMACGTPVVGTAWGGLRDTIKDRENGYQVALQVSSLGVKVNWWDAAHKTIQLLREARGTSDARAKIRRTTEQYALSRYPALLNELLRRCARTTSSQGAPLMLSEFGRRFWELCARPQDANAHYVYDTESFEYYRELIAVYAGSVWEGVELSSPLNPDHVLSLATPVTLLNDSRLRVNDPLYPFEVNVPNDKRAGVEQVLAVIICQPVVTVRGLIGEWPRGNETLADAIRWMLNSGLILRSQHRDGNIMPRMIDGMFSKAVFNTQRVDRSATDFLLFENGQSVGMRTWSA